MSPRARGVQIPAPAAVAGALTRHAHAIVDVVVGSDGRLLASADISGAVHLCELEMGREIHQLDLGAPVAALATTSNTVLAATTQGAFCIHGFGGRVVGVHAQGQAVTSVAVSTDGMWGACATAHSVSLFRLATLRAKYSLEAVGVQALWFEADKLCAWTGERVYAWTLRDGADAQADAAKRAQRPQVGASWSLAHPSGRASIEVGEDGAIRIVLS